MVPIGCDLLSSVDRCSGRSRTIGLLPIKPAAAAEAAAGAAAERVADHVVVGVLRFDAGVAFGESVRDDYSLFGVGHSQAAELFDDGAAAGLIQFRPAVVRRLLDDDRERYVL